MKISFLTQPARLLLTVICFACGGENTSVTSSNTPPTEDMKVVESTPAASVPTPVEEPKAEEIAAEDSQELTGEDKVANSDCLSCHMVERKVIGPSYQDVAAEYENNDANVAMLAKKIIEGGVGVWGEVPMPPHATLSEEDAKDMVRYILSISPH